MAVRGVWCWCVAGGLWAPTTVCAAQSLPATTDTSSHQSLAEDQPGNPQAHAAAPFTPLPAASGYGPHAPGSVDTPPARRTEAESRPLGRPDAPTMKRAGDETRALKGDGAKRATGGVIWPLAGVLTLVVISGAAVRMLARRSGGFGAALGAGGRSPAGLLEILGRYPVGRGTSLVLLKLDRRVLLLSQSAGGRFGAGFATLCEITDPEEVASILVKTRDAEGDSMAERFRSLLTRFDGEDPSHEPASEMRSSRRVIAAAAGDRAELWDDGRAEIPIVDLTLRPQTGDSVSLLKKRLAALGGRGAP